jgi:hypothetical protein
MGMSIWLEVAIFNELLLSTADPDLYRDGSSYQDVKKTWGCIVSRQHCDLYQVQSQGRRSCRIGAEANCRYVLVSLCIMRYPGNREVAAAACIAVLRLSTPMKREAFHQGCIDVGLS